MSGANETAAAFEAHIEPIERDECMALLRTATVGRLGFVVDGRPHILPVNFALDGDRVVFRTAEGTVLNQAAFSSVVFEVDQIDEATRSGWSVLVHGVAQDIGDAIDTTSERIRSIGLVSWAPGARPRWFDVLPHQVTGRRLSVVPVGT